MAKIKVLVGSNYTEKTLLESKLTKEGDRAVDQMEIYIPKNEAMAVNDKIYYQQDFLELNNLSLCMAFNSNVYDESGIFNHGSATAITYEDEEDWYGKQASFNGSSSFISVPDNNNLDLSGQFDIYVWAKWTATTNGHIFDKRGSSFFNGYALSVNRTTAGDVAFKMGGTIITSSSAGFNDGNKHLIRITRNSSNLVTLYVDGVSKGTATITGNGTNTDPLLIGKGITHTVTKLFQANIFQASAFDTTTDYTESSSTNFFNGKILRFRIYKGVVLGDEQAVIIKDKINPRSVLKFGGYVTKIEISESRQKIIAQSFGKVLVETEVRGQNYDGKTPEYILNDLITNNTNFTFSDRGQASGLTVDKFIADGKLYDIVRDFASFTNRVFYTTPLEEFFFEPTSFNKIEGKTYTHGTGNVLVNKKGYDDTKLVNSLTLIGQVQEFTKTTLFSGDGNEKVFNLNHAAITVEVKVGGVYQDPIGDIYELDTLSKAITFTTAPVSGTNNIEVSYTYEVPMVIKGDRASSISKYGLHAKKLVMDWITNRTDGVRFVQSYLNRYAQIQERTGVTFGTLLGYLNENDVINVKNTNLGINADYAIKSITWNYPSLQTDIIVGEYYFDYFEDDQEIVRKLHDFENAITTQKEIQDYESPEETLNLTDVVIQVNSENYSESLNVATSVNEYEKTRATWGGSTSKYGSRITQNIYGSGA